MDNNQYLDKISEALEGEFGSKRQRDVEKRIDWIINKIEGGTVLDVGCSQGALEFFLIERNPNIQAVVGVDAATESIAYANSALSTFAIKDKIVFLNQDFLTMEEDVKFDYIVIAEVLEHLNEPEIFLRKASHLLKQDGKLIVTVPFGINDFPDHKRTYYFSELYKQVSLVVPVTEYEFLGNWIGIV